MYINEYSSIENEDDSIESQDSSTEKMMIFARWLSQENNAEIIVHKLRRFDPLIEAQVKQEQEAAAKKVF